MKHIKLFEELFLKKDKNLEIKELILKFLYLNPGKNSNGEVKGYIHRKLKNEFNYYKIDITVDKCSDELANDNKIKKFEYKATLYLELQN